MTVQVDEVNERYPGERRKGVSSHLISFWLVAFWRWILNLTPITFTGFRQAWRISNFTICIMGAALGLCAGLIFMRDFIFSQGPMQYWDLNWWYSSSIYPQHYTWDQFIQAPVNINRMLVYLPVYMFPAELGQRLLYLFVFSMMGMSTFFVTYKLTAPRHVTVKAPLIISVLVTLLFIMNPVVITNVWYWQILLVYALMPLLIYSSYVAFREVHSLRWSGFITKSIPVALFLFIMSFEPRLNIFFPLLLIGFAAGFSRPHWDYMKRSALLLALILLFYTVFSSYWLVPVFLGTDTQPYWYVYSRNYVDSSTQLSNASLFNAFSLQVLPSNFVADIYSDSAALGSLWKSSLIAVAIISFGALLFRRSKLIVWLAVFAFMFMFLGKGTSSPFGGFYEWLVFDSPVISSFGYQFRKNFIWELPLMACYSIMFGLSLSYFFGFIRDKIKRLRIRRTIFALSVIVLVALPSFAAYPYFSGDLNGTMKAQELEEYWKDFNQWMEEEGTDCKIVYCPRPPWWGSPKPTQPHYYSGTIPSHSPLLPQFLMRSLAENDTSRFGELQTPWNGKYIAIWASAYRVPQSDMELVQQFGGLQVYENLENCSQVEVSDKNVMVVGGLENALSLVALDTYDIVDSSMIFADQLVTNGRSLRSAEVVLSNLGNLDLYMCLLDEDYVLETLWTSDNPESYGWTMASAENIKHADWHHFLRQVGLRNWQYDYGLGFVRSHGRAYLSVPVEIEDTGYYDVLVRCFRNALGKEIRVLFDGEIVGNISTESQLNEFVWVHVDKLLMEKGNHIVGVEQVVGGWNTVNVLAVLPAGELENYESQVDELVATKRMVSVWEAETALNHADANASDSYGSAASNGAVLELLVGSEAWRDFEVARDDNYSVGVRLAGSAVLDIDANGFEVSSGELGFDYIGPVYLEKGTHRMEVSPGSSGSCDLDVIWLYTVEDEGETIEDIFVAEDEPARVVEYRKVDPTKYHVTVSAERPFMLSFAEAYDHLWVARVNGNEYASVPLNSVVNGFWIEDTGDLEITIEFKPQKWFCWGVTISIIGQVAALAFILWDWRKRSK